MKRVIALLAASLLAVLAGGTAFSSPGPGGASVAQAQTAPTEELSASGITDLAGDPLSGGGDYLVSRDGNFVYWWFKTRS